MAKPKYYDKMGAPIDKARWLELKADLAYVEALTYSNNSIKLVLVWLGKVVDPTMMDAEYWPLFRLDVFNIADGRMVAALETGETYGSFEAGRRAYQEFLLQWGGGEMVMTAKGEIFEEVDNIYAPPPEPDQDAPESVVAIGDDGCSVW